MVDAQPPAPPAAVQVLRSEARFVTAAVRDIPLVLTKAGRVENALARYQIYVKTQVQASATEGAPPECAWILTTHIQRQLCFTSMTGQFACTEAQLADQADKQDGRTQLTSTAELEACGLAHPLVQQAEKQLAQAVGATAIARFDADLKLNLTPVLSRTGAVVKRGN